LRKQPKQERSRALVDAVVEATARVISSDGVDRLTTNRVAEVAGVSVGSLYQYFSDKTSLVEAARGQYDRDFEERIRGLLSRLADLPVREAVSEWVELMVRIHAENPTLHNGLAAEVPEDARAPMLELFAGFLAARPHEIRRPDPVLAAEVMLLSAEALIHGTALRSPERLGDASFVAEIRDILLRYILAEPRP